MKVEIKGHACIVTREDGDPKYYGNHQAAGESRLLHQVKLALNAQGYDLIKKRMCSDGHLKDDCQQYLRTRNKTGDPKRDIYVYNESFALRGANDDYNKGQVVLNVVFDVFNV